MNTTETKLKMRVDRIHNQETMKIGELQLVLGCRKIAVTTWEPDDQDEQNFKTAALAINSFEAMKNALQQMMDATTLNSPSAIMEARTVANAILENVRQ